METHSRLDEAIDLLVEEIDNNIIFYSEEARSYFIENVVYIMLDSTEENLQENLFYFLEENYHNYSQIQTSLNEGIGSWVRGAAKAVGSAIGGVGRAFKQGLVGGRPAEKIAFGPAPTTAVAGKDGKDGTSGGGGKGVKDTEEGGKSPGGTILNLTIGDIGSGVGAGAGAGAGSTNSGSGTPPMPAINIKGTQSIAGRDNIAGDKAENGSQIIKNNAGDIAAQVGDNTKTQNSGGPVIAQETDAAQRAADTTARRRRTGGKIPGQVSDTANAKRKRAERAAKRGASGTSSSGSSPSSVAQTMGGNDEQGPRIVKTTKTEPAKPEPTKPESKKKTTTTKKTTKKAASAEPAIGPTNEDVWTDAYTRYMDRFLQG